MYDYRVGPRVSDMATTVLDKWQMGPPDVLRAAKKALVIEDHQDLREILTRQMELIGFTVIAAEHGKDGVEKAAEQKPTLILMDILMREMDGREATSMIRSNPETHNIPILAATGLFSDSALVGCLEAGCNDYIVEPFTLEQLRNKVQEFIPRSATPAIH